MKPCWLCSHPSPEHEERQGEGHHAVRFGDRFLEVTLDGVDVSNSAFESMAGEDGWVLVYPNPKRVCETDRTHAHAERWRGRVDVAAGHLA
jgi:hypothetical protein